VCINVKFLIQYARETIPDIRFDIKCRYYYAQFHLGKLNFDKRKRF